MKAVKRIVKIVLFLLLAIIFVASVISIISSIGQRKNGYTGAFGYTFEVVASDSMSGTFEVGDIVIGKVIDADTVINVDDIISYRTIINGKWEINTHRVVSTWEEGSLGTVYETKGDYVGSSDPDFRIRDDIVSVYCGKIPGAGKVINAIKTPAGFLALAIPIALYILYEIFVLIGIFLNNKKQQMLEETQDAREAIIREYLASQQKKDGADPEEQQKDTEHGSSDPDTGKTE